MDVHALKRVENMIVVVIGRFLQRITSMTVYCRCDFVI